VGRSQEEAGEEKQGWPLEAPQNASTPKPSDQKSRHGEAADQASQFLACAHQADDLLLPIRRQSVNLGILVRRVADTLRVTGEGAQHTVEVSAEDAWVDADPTRIEQVIHNLLTNAIKYTPPGGTIRLTAGVQGADAVLGVADTGLGIPPSLLPRVFELFVQGERTLDRRAGGLGIGLTLVRRLVEFHDGAVTASSSSEGSVFTVRLPRIEAPLPIGLLKIPSFGIVSMAAGGELLAGTVKASPAITVAKSRANFTSSS